MLSITGATRTIDHQTLFTGLHLVVPPGHCAAVVGPNGSGKSTLLRCVIDDDRLDAGSIDVFGMAPDDRSPRFRALVSADTGDDATFFDVTVAEHLELLVRTHRTGTTDIDAALTQAGLGDLADRYPHTLSSGQRQRFALAAAFLRPSRLLVLDEPERALDADGQHWAATEIEAATASGRAVLIASHSAALVQRCADQIVELGR
ncbi:putative ABC transport system, ATP-binding protein [Gordonia polyisoprenivorans VH2]|uniref:Putative ABC transport system, ATP-binding protein n=1 Tax=Gordonia polyisoprenivorans (strain DSM 44266 / VH2) TaxID=1112204 RepID=H6MS58_GORPV|nr:ATP-binding cassette domain-containing protein [Gordonia polyisoprenivorans]AFA75071.1 putative ABC transport system, ATP-binding protein [Gordonia polyisoprenivorans VH2]